MASESTSRPYRKRKRAEQEEETRLRITEAAVELHGSVGPANTTVTEVARQAGVSRMTVYNHFPSEVELFVACSSHWAEQNPFPDPGNWAEIDDPRERLTVALREFYAWYRDKDYMMGKVFRDVPLVPALAERMATMWGGYVDAVIGVLSVGWADAPDRTLDAALRLVVDYGTWKSLTSESELSDDEAAELATSMVEGARVEG